MAPRIERSTPRFVAASTLEEPLVLEPTEEETEDAQLEAERPTLSTSLESRAISRNDLTVQQIRSGLSEGFYRNEDGSSTFKGTARKDSYSIVESPDGTLAITNDRTQKTFTLSAERARAGVFVETGAGDDSVRIDGVKSANLAIRTGAGNDRIEATNTTANLTLEGGAGQDYLLGGGGADRLDGGAGADAIYADKNDLSIDAGASKRTGEDDADVVISESGAVRAQNLAGLDKQFDYDRAEVERYLAKNPRLVIEGSEPFRERTMADLGVMLKTQQGRGLLDELSAALEQSDEKLKFAETTAPGGRYDPMNNTITVSTALRMLPTGQSIQPVVTLFHELVHAHQQMISGLPQWMSRFRKGGEVSNSERAAVGLSWIDELKVLHPAGELPYTENKFRRELGLPERRRYGIEEGPPRWAPISNREVKIDLPPRN